MRSIGGLGVGLLLVALAAGGAGAVELWPPAVACHGHATAKIAHLERIEARRFAGLEHRTVARDLCDERGRPAAFVHVRVLDWTTREQGIAFLQQPPWRWDAGRQSATLPGQPGVTAGVIVEVVATGTWIVIYLDLPA